MNCSFQDIIAWREAHKFVLSVYQVTSSFPNSEKFGLTSQFQRAAVSIPANIAEGYRKLSKADKLRFLNIAQGSLEECRYYILLAKDLKYISQPQHDSLCIQIETTSKLLNGYCKGIINHSFDKKYIMHEIIVDATKILRKTL